MAPKPISLNTLFYADNLPENIADESVDLIYLDHRLNSSPAYNVLFKEGNGTASDAPDPSLRRRLALGPISRGHR